MQVDGKPVAIIYSGAADVFPADLLVYLRSRLLTLQGVGTEQAFYFQTDPDDDEGDRVFHCRLRREIAEYKVFIHDVTCSSYDGFLIVLKNSIAVQEPNPEKRYYAHFVDGFTENINPIDGEPRPDPETAERTVDYVLPIQLRLPVTKRASQFSGQMRHVVQCYHGEGRQAPFSFNAYKTHGIVEFPKRDEATNTLGKFWIVQVDMSGVWAAPISFSNRCCDLTDVDKYLATDEEIAEFPSRQQYQDELDLQWYWTAHGKEQSGVVQLLTQAQIGQCWYGSPIADSIGWAFSYSGHEAQNIFFLPNNPPVNYWEVSRWKISFAYDETTDTLSASVAAIDYRKKYLGNTFGLVWFPSDDYPGYYEQLFPFSYNGITTSSIQNWQDVPIHVYYDGESEILVTSTNAYRDSDNRQWGQCQDAAVFGNIPLNDAARWRENRGAGNFGYFSYLGDQIKWDERSLTLYSADVWSGAISSEGWQMNNWGGPNPPPRQAGVGTWLSYRLVRKYTEQHSGTDTFKAACIIGMHEREGVWLVQRRTYNTSGNWSNTLVGVLWRQNWDITYTEDPFNSNSERTQTVLPFPILGTPNFPIPAEPDLTGCPVRGAGMVPVTDNFADFWGIPKGQANQTTSGTIIDRDDTWSAWGHLGNVHVVLSPTTSDAVKFTDPINPVLNGPAVKSPGPYGFHSGVYYFDSAEEPDYKKVFVYSGGGTSGWTVGGGIAGLASSDFPIAFVGRI